MRTDIFLDSVTDNQDAVFVRKALASDIYDANYLWYMLSGSGYIDVDADTEDIQKLSLDADHSYDVEGSISAIDGTEGLTNLLTQTDTAHPYKWADNSYDKLTVVCLALYKALA